MVSSLDLLTLEDLVECEIIKRINRFVVEVEMGSARIFASINNTGRLEDFLVKGRTGYCIGKEGGKTRYKLVAVRDKEGGAILDTNLQMKAFERALKNEYILWLSGYRISKRNPRVGGSRLDYLLDNEDKLYVEVKSAVLRVGNEASYPDCPTERGRRHIMELIDLARKGERAMILFIAGLPGVRSFIPARWIDARIAELLKEAREAGVEIKALSMHLNTNRKVIVLENPDLPVRI